MHNNNNTSNIYTHTHSTHYKHEEPSINCCRKSQRHSYTHTNANSMAVRSLVYYLLTAWSQRIYLALHRHASPSTSIHFICHSTNTLHTNINALAEAQKKPTKSERWQFAALSAEVQPHTALAESRNAHMHHQVAHRYVFEWPHGMHSECDLNRSHSHSFVRLNSPTGSMQQFERVVCCRVRRAA